MPSICRCNLTAENSAGTSTPLALHFTTSKTPAGLQPSPPPPAAPPAAPILQVEPVATQNSTNITIGLVSGATSYYILCSNVTSQGQYQYAFHPTSLTFELTGLDPDTLVQ